MPLTDEQHRLRGTGIGSSEIGAIIYGRDHFGRTLYDLWLLKTKQMPRMELADNPVIEMGNIIEPGLIEWLAKRVGATASKAGTHRHPEHAIVVATPDAFLMTPDGTKTVAEVKAPHWSTISDWGDGGTDEIPDYYMPQVQWEMGATGCKAAHVAALLDKPTHYTVPFSQPFFTACLDAASDFWLRNVVGDEMPELVEGSALTNKWLRKKFPSHTDGFVDASTHEHELIGRFYRKAYAERMQWQKAEATAKQQLQLIIGDREGIQFSSPDLGRITYRKASDSAQVDWKGIVEELGAPPELVAKHTSIRAGTRRMLPPRAWKQGEVDE